MIERTSASIVIDAPIDRCLAVALDFETYPQWAEDVRRATIAARDEDGRASEVEYTVAAMGRGTRYTLRYDHADLPNVLRWSLVTGQIMRVCDGAYRFSSFEGSDDRTEVVYELEIGLKVPHPGFLRRRAETRIVRTAMTDLKRWVETRPAS